MNSISAREAGTIRRVRFQTPIENEEETALVRETPARAAVRPALKEAIRRQEQEQLEGIKQKQQQQEEERKQ